MGKISFSLAPPSRHSLSFSKSYLLEKILLFFENARFENGTDLFRSKKIFLG
ncbi:hypothetical protein LEP1GSC050_1944 [Leptospira broomii serovar Hurstbridge str. 5399]|uniref:Uncharacterized protein n=1 Tax=Leptospira broomii serovar Hurstbridge str. 5399 TaxID=1049789 RepID=T0GII5_9LEPT|nr:hypothetical protein LEP1GSC050_1944 [Leptospira broomii serovar Hurstbridge str. 5399]